MNKIAMLRTGLRVFAEMSKYIPTSEDTLWSGLVKLVGAVHAVDSTVYGSQSRLNELVYQHDLVFRESHTEQKIFWGSNLHQRFQIQRVRSDHSDEIVQAIAPDGESLFFLRNRQYHHGNPPYMHTRGFDFGMLRELFWQSYPEGVLWIGGATKRESFAPAPMGSRTMSKQARDRAASLTADLAKFKAIGVHRTYLFFGPPGTGKTASAMAICRATGGRLLKLSAGSLCQFGGDGPALDGIQFVAPTLVLIDDIDSVSMSSAQDVILDAMESLRQSGATVILTANDVHKLPAAMLRPGRIDVPVEFHLSLIHI